MELINGKKISKQILKSLKSWAANCQPPAELGVILVGHNPASRLYVRLKQKAAKQIGIGFKKYIFPSRVAPELIQKQIRSLNQNKKITAILIQLPLPKQFNAEKIISLIAPRKDADGLHPKHLAMLKKGKKPTVLPATTEAILAAIEHTKVNIKNKSVAIIGKSKIVGLPTYYYLKDKVKKINIYDSHTQKLANKTSQADILIVAIGQAKFITAEYIKSGAIVIDVGINKIKDKTIGDVDFNSIKKKAAWITPVPGGIGPLTIAMLLKNVLKLSK